MSPSYTHGCPAVPPVYPYRQRFSSEYRFHRQSGGCIRSPRQAQYRRCSLPGAQRRSYFQDQRHSVMLCCCIARFQINHLPDASIPCEGNRYVIVCLIADGIQFLQRWKGNDAVIPFSFNASSIRIWLERASSSVGGTNPRYCFCVIPLFIITSSFPDHFSVSYCSTFLFSRELIFFTFLLHFHHRFPLYCKA